jgi:hypothetical protein
MSLQKYKIVLITPNVLHFFALFLAGADFFVILQRDVNA